MECSFTLVRFCKQSLELLLARLWWEYSVGFQANRSLWNLQPAIPLVRNRLHPAGSPVESDVSLCDVASRDDSSRLLSL
jgi:hypothetical protein